MKRIIPIILAGLLAGCGSTSSPSSLKPGAAEQVMAPAAGVSLDAGFWSTFAKPKDVRNWVYEVSISGTPPATVEAGIKTDDSGKLVAVVEKVDLGAARPEPEMQLAFSKYLAYGSFEMLVEDEISISGAPIDLEKYKSDGPDNIVVPAGEFKGAARIFKTKPPTICLSQSLIGKPCEDDRFTYWYAPGPGLVKYVQSSEGKAFITVELKSYTP